MIVYYEFNGIEIEQIGDIKPKITKRNYGDINDHNMLEWEFEIEIEEEFPQQVNLKDCLVRPQQFEAQAVRALFRFKQ